MERAPETARKSIGSFTLSMVQPGSSSAPEETEGGGVHVCEVCGACFETKRGLSSHCRSHLRQLHVAVSDSSGAPIDLLYQLIRQRDGKLPFSSGQAAVDKLPEHKTPKKLKSPKTFKTLTSPLTPKTPKNSQTPKKDSTTKLKIKISTLVKKKYSKSPTASLTLLPPTSSSPPQSPGSAPPQLSPPKLSKTHTVLTEPEKVPVPLSPPLTVTSKPLWAPQDTDAPLNLTAMTAHTLRDDVHVCELCGAWYETRKGLSSHVRAHLRQFGVEMDAKGAPIDVLHELLQRDKQLGERSPPHLDDFRGCSPSSPAPKCPSPSIPETEVLHTAPPPQKKLKTSPAGAESEVQQKGDLVKDVSCEFCHEKFKKSQSLASHARCHLRQLGVTEWTVHGSPMATLRELMARRGATNLPKPHTPTKHSGTPANSHFSPSKSHVLPTALLTTSTKPHTPSAKSRSPSTVPHSPPAKSHSPPIMPHTPPTKHHTPPTSPHTPPAKPLLSTSLSPRSVAPLPLTSGSSPILPGPTPLRVPKARKGTRMVVSKPKDEPVEISVTEPKPKNTPAHSLSSSRQTSTVEVDIPGLVRCEFCSEVFDSRKGLSCHARAHLRQLGVRWSPNASPIDTLYQLMLSEGTLLGSEVRPETWRKTSLQTFTPSPADKTDSLDCAPTGSEATCELCGFDFENRKALASHARAHLRQQGVDWHANGSPIETLAEWMQREPGKVAELHKRYMRGDLPQVVKKRSSSSPHPSLSEPESARPAPVREVKGHSSTSSAHRKPLASQHTPAHTSARGCERRPPKHLNESRLGAGPRKPRVGNAPSLMPRPPENSLVKLVGKMYSLKCRFCEEVFRGPLSVQEDWLIHLRQHILNLKQDSTLNPDPTPDSPAPTLPHADTAQLIGAQTV